MLDVPCWEYGRDTNPGCAQKCFCGSQNKKHFINEKQSHQGEYKITLFFISDKCSEISVCTKIEKFGNAYDVSIGSKDDKPC